MRLHGLLCVLFTIMIFGCGGSGSTSDQGSADSENNATENQDNDSNNDNNICIECQKDLPTIKVVGDLQKQNAPITFGQTFKKGKYPSDSKLVALINDETIPTQSDIKATHDDGSVRHAIVSLLIPEVTNLEQEVSFSISDSTQQDIEQVTISDVINSGLDTQLDIDLYGVMINELVFGDRSISWFHGDLITMNFNGSTYQYEVKSDDSAFGEELGNSYRIGESAARYFEEQITAEHSNVGIFIRYERMYIKGTRDAKSYSLSVSNSGNAPVTQTLLTNESDTVTYNINVKDALENTTGFNTINTWLQGSIASEWIVTTPLIHPETTQPHPQLQAQFHIRAFSGIQQVKTDIVVENVWSHQDQVSNLFYDISIHNNNETIFTDSIEHYSHARWKKTFWWGEAPDYAIKQDIGYVIASNAIPNYDISIEASQAAIEYYADQFSGSDYELMGVGSATKYMPQTGAHEDIGPIPRWQALYVISNDSRAKQATILNSDLAGTWSIHYRDKDTGLPISIDDYPYLTILSGNGDTYNPETEQYEAFPDCSGFCGTPYVHDTSHQPSFSYVPYLITGDYFHMEEMIFWANYNLFSSNPGYRQQEKGLQT